MRQNVYPNLGNVTPIESESFTYDKQNFPEVQISTIIPISPNYLFVEWETSEGYSFDPGDYLYEELFEGDNEVTLYAVWINKSSIKYTLTFDAGSDGTCNKTHIHVTEQEYDNDDIILLPDVIPDFGYTFNGWDDGSDEDNPRALSEINATDYNEDHTLTAFYMAPHPIVWVKSENNSSYTYGLLYIKEDDDDFTQASGLFVNTKNGWKSSHLNLKSNWGKVKYLSFFAFSW
jgi:hypothetical protein